MAENTSSFEAIPLVEYDQTDAVQPPDYTGSTEPSIPTALPVLVAHGILRYRKQGLCLLAIYVPLLAIPWIITCILSFRPVNHSTYVNQKSPYSPKDLQSINTGLEIIGFFNWIGALITIPITSALLAQAAVIYTQRKSQKQALSVRQTFALADRAWANPHALWRTIDEQKYPVGSKFLWIAAAFLLFSLVQWPIRSVLVQLKQFQVMTCNDSPVYIENKSKSCDLPDFNQLAIGYDPEPADLAAIPRDIVIAQVANQLITTTDKDVELHLWPEPGGDINYYSPEQRSTFSYYFNSFNAYESKSSRDFFVSSLPNNTNTGILREHALRLNSTVDCEVIARDSMPSTCSGPDPFTTSYIDENNLEIRICIPGNQSESLWTTSRDRQDVQEQAFVDVMIFHNSTLQGLNGAFNFTVQCTAASTRGYFELGNYLNNFIHGPLLSLWPDVDDIQNNFNDYIGDYSGDIPTVNNSESSPYASWLQPPNPFHKYPYINDDTPTSGPLMTSFMSLFGNTSFFYALANANDTSLPFVRSTICETGRVPFQRVGSYIFRDDTDYCSVNQSYEIDRETRRAGAEREDASAFLVSWFSYLNETSQAEGVLDMALYFTHETMLTQTASLTGAGKARPIYSSPGLTITKPYISLGGIIAISVLIGLQVLGLLVLTLYIYQVPTWTGSLDALALARMGAYLKDTHLPEMSLLGDDQLQKELNSIDGLVALKTTNEYGNGEGTIQDTSQNFRMTLGLGAGGIIMCEHGKLQKQSRRKKGSPTSGLLLPPTYDAVVV